MHMNKCTVDTCDMLIIEEVLKEPEEESEEEKKIMRSTSTVELTLLSPNMLSEQVCFLLPLILQL